MKIPPHCYFSYNSAVGEGVKYVVLVMAASSPPLGYLRLRLVGGVYVCGLVLFIGIYISMILAMQRVPNRATHAADEIIIQHCKLRLFKHI